MAMFISPYLILDTLALVCATPCDGEAEHDGMYGLYLVLEVGNKARHALIDYPDKATRAVDFAALGALLREDARRDALPQGVDIPPWEANDHGHSF